MKLRSPLILFIVMASLYLSACSAAPSELAEEAATSVPEVLPTQIVVQAPEVDQCVTCHVDKNQLIATAKIEEEVVKESEGPG